MLWSFSIKPVHVIWFQDIHITLAVVSHCEVLATTNAWSFGLYALGVLDAKIGSFSPPPSPIVRVGNPKLVELNDFFIVEPSKARTLPTLVNRLWLI